MQIKHLLSGAVLVAAFPLTAIAGYEGKAENMVNALNLQGEKAEQVQEILESHGEQKKQVKKLAHEQINFLNDVKKQRLESVLSEDEMERYEALKKDKKEAAHANHADKWKDHGKRKE